MKQNLIETVLGAIVLIVAIFFLIHSTSTADIGDVKGYRVTATFGDIGGLSAGQDVRISGVKIGTISSVSLNNSSYFAEVEMTIDPAVRLPDDTSARISSESLLGGSYLALEPGGSEEFISGGGRIAYTQDAQNLEQLLGKFIFSLQDSKEDKGAADTPPPSPFGTLSNEDE